MHVIKATSKSHLFEEIKKIDANHDEIYVNLRPTIDLIQAIYEKCPNLSKLYCPQSLLKQTAKKAFKSAGDQGIKIEAGNFAVGRPQKYENTTILEIVNQRKAGKPAKKISVDMNIPLRTVYFYLQQK